MNKVYYYRDEVNDDFASSNGKIDRDTVNGEYKYSHHSVWWKIGVVEDVEHLVMGEEAENRLVVQLS